MEDMLEERVGEYFPRSAEYHIDDEHRHRYLLAGRYVRDARVLDISCGAGCGTAMLAQTAKSVVGVEIDAAAVHHARAHCDQPHVHFVRADAAHFALMPGSVDVVVRFETPERVEGDEAFLDAMKSSLTAEGVLIVSTPDCRVNWQGEQTDPRERELSQQEWIDRLKQHFRHVQLLGHDRTANPVIAEAASGTPEAGCAIAFCSDAPLPAVPRSVMAGGNERLVHELRDQLADATARAERAENDRARTRAHLADTCLVLDDTQVELTRVQRQLTEARLQLAAARREASDQAKATNRRLVQTLACATTLADRGTVATVGRADRGTPPSLRTLVIVPGLNYFYNQTGRRVAEALRNIGFAAEVHTLQDSPDADYDWCFIVNVYETTEGYKNAAGEKDTEGALRRIAAIRARCNRTSMILLESTGTNWFAYSFHLFREAHIDTLLDLGFHDQSGRLPAEAKPRYTFAFNGLTESERRAIPNPSAPLDDRAIPWAFVGHLTNTRAALVRRLLRDVDPNGFVYMPQVTTVTEDGPHINEQQFQTVLAHARYQIWCTHHPHFYLESERFRHSLLAGGVPVKVVPRESPIDRRLPFPYLLLDEYDFDEHLRAWDFVAMRRRFVDDFRALPMLEDSLAEALARMAAQQAPYG